jgi:threonine dehydrogenase-like Zn-dependent dehydrogenase
VTNKKKQYAAVCCAGRWGFLTKAAAAAERDVAAAPREALRMELAAAVGMERGVAELVLSSQRAQQNDA